MTKKLIKIALFLLAGTFLILIGYFIQDTKRIINSAFDANYKCNFPRINQKIFAPDSEFALYVFKSDGCGKYYLGFGIKNKSIKIFSEEIISEEYHTPIIKIKWENNNLAEINIDHDFGEGNLKYLFNRKELELTKKKP